jgi:carboxyl-terminal processing protease
MDRFPAVHQQAMRSWLWGFAGLIALAMYTSAVVPVSAQSAGSSERLAAIDQLFKIYDLIVDHHVTRPHYGRLASLTLDGAGRPPGKPTAPGLADAMGHIASLGPDREKTRVALLHELASRAPDAGAIALIDATLKGLGPRNQYLPDGPQQMPPTWGSVGLELTQRNGAYVVLTALQNRPAGRAGIQAGDEILALAVRDEKDSGPWDEVAARELSLEQVFTLLRGYIGTSVRIKVRRPGTVEPLSFQLVREVIGPDSVGHNVIGGRTGYIRIRTFGSDSSTQVASAMRFIASATAERLDGVILDLRANRGGLVDEAIAVADHFLEQGRITRLTGRNAADNRTADATPGDIAKGKPIVVLVDGNTAEGAELMTLALAKNGRARVVGQKTAGLGLVTTVYAAGARAVLVLQTGHWHDPAGEPWHGKGITPDVPTTAADRSDVQDGDIKRAVTLLRGGR